MAKKKDAEVPTLALVPVPAPEANGQPVAAGPRTVLDMLARDDRVPAMTFDPKTDEGGWLLQKCEEDTRDKLREMIGQTLKVRHVYSRVLDFTHPDTGEVYPILRIVLVDTDDNTYGCASAGVGDSILRLALRHGPPPWPAGIPVLVKQQITRKDHARLVLMEVFARDKKGGGQ